jgi:hypothetical protein
MMNMMSPNKKMSTLILDFNLGQSSGKKGESESKEEKISEDDHSPDKYPLKLAQSFADAVKSGDKKAILSTFKELMNCCSSDSME